MKNPGRIEVVSTKPCTTQSELALAYTPGVAEPCKAIIKTPDDAYVYTSKGTLIAAVTNGSAVPGLGNVGPLAAKPYMEALASVYKKVADLDLFDIEINSRDHKLLKKSILSFQPTFGGFLLSGISAPDCYLLQSALKQEMYTPVILEATGIAVATVAACLNASKLKSSSLREMHLVCYGNNELKKAVIQQLFFLEADPLQILSSKNAAFEYAVSVAKYSDILLMFEGCEQNHMQLVRLLHELPPDPVIILLNKNLVSKIELICEIRGDALVIPLDPLLKNGIDSALACPYLLRNAINGRRQITPAMLRDASYALAGMVDETDIIEEQILLPGIIDETNSRMLVHSFE